MDYNELGAQYSAHLGHAGERITELEGKVAELEKTVKRLKAKSTDAQNPSYETLQSDQESYTKFMDNFEAGTGVTVGNAESEILRLRQQLQDAADTEETESISPYLRQQLDSAKGTQAALTAQIRTLEKGVKKAEKATERAQNERDAALSDVQKYKAQVFRLKPGFGTPTKPTMGSPTTKTTQTTPKMPKTPTGKIGTSYGGEESQDDEEQDIKVKKRKLSPSPTSNSFQQKFSKRAQSGK